MYIYLSSTFYLTIILESVFINLIFSFTTKGVPPKTLLI